MERSDNTFYCPFCSGSFHAEEVLFVDEDKTGTVGDVSEYDPEQYEFQKKILSFIPIEAADGTLIKMEERPKYMYHRWHEVDSMPFWKPISISESDTCGIPNDITVYRSKGMTPNQLAAREPAPWEHMTSAVEEEKPPEEPEKKLSAGEALRDMMRAGLVNQQKAQKAVASEQIFMPEDVERTLSNKACPLCHCLLPERFGSIPVYRVAMLGGTAAGKTTHMIAVANLLELMTGLPGGIINGCQICTESRRYFDFLISCLEYDKLVSTPVEDATVVRFVFPIVMNMTAMTQDGMREDEFTLIINDMPGEGMEDRDFLMTYPGLLTTNAAIMLLDPTQFTGAQKKKTLIKKDMAVVHMNPDDKEGYEQHARSFTPISFDKTLTNIKSLLQQNKFNRISSLTMVLNKLDLLYGGEEPVLDMKKKEDASFVCVNGQNDMNEQHSNGMNLAYIERLSNQVEHIIEKKLKFSTYTSSMNSIRGSLKNEIYTLCISIRSWNAGTGEFDSARDPETKFIDRSEIIGFRMLEPLLVSLTNLGLLRTKDDPVTGPEVDERSGLRKFFDWLLRRDPSA